MRKVRPPYVPIWNPCHSYEKEQTWRYSSAIRKCGPIIAHVVRNVVNYHIY